MGNDPPRGWFRQDAVQCEKTAPLMGLNFLVDGLFWTTKPLLDRPLGTAEIVGAVDATNIRVGYVCLF